MYSGILFDELLSEASIDMGQTINSMIAMMTAATPTHLGIFEGLSDIKRVRRRDALGVISRTCHSLEMELTQMYEAP